MVASALMMRTEAEDFLYMEAQLQDEKRWVEWLGLWAPDEIELWMPMNPLDNDRVKGSTMLQDDRARLEQRVERLGHPALYSQLPPARTNRIIGNVRCEDLADSQVKLLSSFQMAEFRPGQQH